MRTSYALIVTSTKLVLPIVWITFLNQVQAGLLRAWFLEITLVRSAALCLVSVHS